MKIPPIREFLNKPEEWHAFWCGFFEVMCPLPERNHMSIDYFFSIEDEHHYYRGGRAAAVIAWILTAKLIHVWFW